VKKDRAVVGDYNVICDLTGVKVKRSQCILRWDGMLVRREVSEDRHPQDFLRAREERNNVRDARPEGPIRTMGVNRTADDL